MGLQSYEHAAIVLGDRRAARPNIADRGGDCRVAGGDLKERLLTCLHPVGRDILAASLTPMMIPVSCCGKKPLGMTAKSHTVAATVVIMTPSVVRRCLRARMRARS